MNNETKRPARLSLKVFSISLLLGATIPAISLAGDQENQIIDKTVAAYGGEKLTGLKSISIKSSEMNRGQGQGYTSDYVAFNASKTEVHLDLAGQRGSDENWANTPGFFDSSRAVSVGDEIIVENYHTGIFEPIEDTDFYGRFGSRFRVNDTLLAFELDRQRESAKYLGSESIRDVMHDKVQFDFPSSPPLTVFINQDTGLISKMQRTTPFGALTYLFTDHRAKSGITYSADFAFYAFSHLNSLVLDRDVTFNKVRDRAFNTVKGLSPAPASLDASELTIEEVSSGIHQVGSNGGYTMFVDAGDHVIGIGGYPDLKGRYTAYLEKAGHEKPLKYQIATHHHDDHIPGLADAVELGATVVTTEMAKAPVVEASGAPENQLQIIDGKTTLGPVELHLIDTSHSADNIALYVPASKVLFQADHYGGEYIDQVAQLSRGSISLHKEISKLGLDVEKMVSAHNRKVEDWAAFSAAVADFRFTPCPMKRKICR